MAVHRHHYLGALILITLGTLLLLRNFNLLPSDFWLNAWRFWPVILILFGLQAILGGNRAGDVAVFILGAGLVYVILAWSLNLPLPKVVADFGHNLPSASETPRPRRYYAPREPWFDKNDLRR